MLRETRERIVARVKIVRKSLALESASGFAFSYHKTKKLNNHHAVMVVIKVIGHLAFSNQFLTIFLPSGVSTLSG